VILSSVNPHRFDAPVPVGQLGILDTSGTNPFTTLPWAVGDKYRLVFVSSGARNGSSSTISDYNTFIQGLADAAGLGAVTWQAVVSTVSVDARDNVNARIGTDPDGPVFKMDGATSFSDSLTDLWATHVDNQRIDLDEDGNLRPRGEDHFWIRRAVNSDDSYDLAIYGMSEVLTVIAG